MFSNSPCVIVCHFGVWIIWMLSMLSCLGIRGLGCSSIPFFRGPTSCAKGRLAVLYNATKIQNIAGHVVGNPKLHCYL